MLKEGSGRKSLEMGALLAEKWTPVLTNVQNGFEIRLIQDLLSPSREGGMLFLALSGKQMGNFDMLYDPHSREQIMAGQLTEREGRLTYNVWTSFAARSNRTGANKPPESGFSLARYRIDAALDPDLRMKVRTRVAVRVGARALRVLPFDISRAMHVTAARLDGAPAELFFQESVRGRALRGTDNDVFLLIAS